MKGEVDAIVAGMEEAGVARDFDALESAKKRLVAFGPECALLLVDLVEPGAQGTDAQKLRAQYVLLTLNEFKSRAVTTRLIEIAQQGSVEGRVNAITALGASPDIERASPVLIGIFRSNQAELRSAALLALAHLGGESNDKILNEGLSDARPEVVASTLEALALARKSSMASRVLKILASSIEAVQHQDALMAYYRSCPETVDKATVLAWIKAGGELSSTAVNRQKVFDFLPQFVAAIDSEAKKQLRVLTESPTKEISEGALVVLVVAGDRNARKELLASYDDTIEKNKEWPSSYSARGDILFKIADYTAAIADFKKAIQLGAEDLRAQQVNAYIGLARCYAMTKRLNDAFTTLDRAPLTAKQLAALKTDPAFAKLIEHPKFKSLFDGK
ncbi:MAG: tetratricopeptide repeat protein [Planctomycetota bacterium]|nr:tetratricopeptide repeat protein [Planctomycetota bacterium]